MSILTAVIPFSIAFVVSALLCRRFIRPGSLLHVLDHPNERSLHDTPVPRTGGVALLVGLAVGVLVAVPWVGFPPLLAWVAVGALLLGVISFVEDRFGVQRRIRFIVHILAALLLVPAGLIPAGLVLGDSLVSVPGWFALSLTLLGAVWMINLYNFMDGMDGFAGGMALIGFGALALAGWFGQQPAFTLANGLIAAAAGGFLTANFPPARIFMGDAGAATLGFLAVAMTLWAAQLEVLALWGGLLVFSPFIVDASVTLLRRLLRGERIWQAHRSHYYQRLVQLGWGHRKTVLRGYMLMGVCAASALRSNHLNGREQLWLLAMWAGIYAFIALKVRVLERTAGGQSRDPNH